MSDQVSSTETPENEMKVTTDFDTQFLQAEHNIAVSERWQYVDRIWDVYKHYITLITGVSGIVLALIPFTTNYSNLLQIISLAACFLFLIGTYKYIQILSLGRDLRRANERLAIVRRTIQKITTLDEYFQKLQSTNATLGYIQQRKYSIFQLVRIGIKTAGLQTQAVVLNSIIGGIAIATTLLFVGWVSEGVLLLFIGIGAFFVLGIAHLLLYLLVW